MAAASLTSHPTVCVAISGRDGGGVDATVAGGKKDFSKNLIEAVKARAGSAARPVHFGVEVWDSGFTTYE